MSLLDLSVDQWDVQVTARMVKAMGPYELPSLLWHLPDDQRREFMKQARSPNALSLLLSPQIHSHSLSTSP